MIGTARLRALLKDAALPWRVVPYIVGDGSQDFGASIEDADGALLTYGGYEGLDAPCSTANAALIVEAVNALPGLLDEREATRDLVAHRLGLTTLRGQKPDPYLEAAALAALDAAP